MIRVRVHKKIEREQIFGVFGDYLGCKDGEIPECAHK